MIALQCLPRRAKSLIGQRGIVGRCWGAVKRRLALHISGRRAPSRSPASRAPVPILAPYSQAVSAGFRCREGCNAVTFHLRGIRPKRYFRMRSSPCALKERCSSCTLRISASRRASLLISHHDARHSLSTSLLFQSRFFGPKHKCRVRHPPVPCGGHDMRVDIARIGAALHIRLWMAMSAIIPRDTSCASANLRTSSICCASPSSCGMDSNSSLASCESFRFSAPSTACHSAWRSVFHKSGVSGGARVSESMMSPCHTGRCSHGFCPPCRVASRRAGRL